MQLRIAACKQQAAVGEFSDRPLDAVCKCASVHFTKPSVRVVAEDVSAAKQQTTSVCLVCSPTETMTYGSNQDRMSWCKSLGSGFKVAVAALQGSYRVGTLSTRVDVSAKVV